MVCITLIRTRSHPLTVTRIRTHLYIHTQSHPRPLTFTHTPTHSNLHSKRPPAATSTYVCADPYQPAPCLLRDMMGAATLARVCDRFMFIASRTKACSEQICLFPTSHLLFMIRKISWRLGLLMAVAAENKAWHCLRPSIQRAFPVCSTHTHAQSHPFKFTLTHTHPH